VNDSSDEQINLVLARLAAGGERSEGELFELVQDHLRNIARRMMRAERRDHTLQPTALVNEAWMKLATGGTQAFQNRTHFIAIAASAMRQILLDHARARKTGRRQADAEALERIREAVVVTDPTFDMILLDQALRRLAARDERLSKIVELRVFCELSVEETAQVLGLSTSTVKREWRIARSFLMQDLGGTGVGHEE
jgi:RNA polymerase sigma factor (TIGR02999 family)